MISSGPLKPSPDPQIEIDQRQGKIRLQSRLHCLRCDEANHSCSLTDAVAMVGKGCRKFCGDGLEPFATRNRQAK
jgi:hypothetical protein